MVDRIQTDLGPWKPGGRFINNDGTPTAEGQRWLDGIWKRSGGFDDGGYATTGDIGAIQSQLAEVNRTLEELLFEFDRVSEVSESALRQALNIEDKNVVTGGIRTRGVGLNQITNFGFARSSPGSATSITGTTTLETVSFEKQDPNSVIIASVSAELLSATTGRVQILIKRNGTTFADAFYDAENTGNFAFRDIFTTVPMGSATWTFEATLLSGVASCSTRTFLIEEYKR